MHYLDNAATTRVLPEAAEAAVHAMLEEFGNLLRVRAMTLHAQRERFHAEVEVKCVRQPVQPAPHGSGGLASA